MTAVSILIGGLLLALAAGCGKSANPGVPSAAASGTAAPSPSSAGDALAFARCMRSHGVNMADPNPNIQWGNLNQAPNWDTAFAACRNLVPAGSGGDTMPNSQELDAYRAYAVCMRAHGIDLSDPDPTGNMTMNGRLAGAGRDQVQNDPGYKAAQTACQDKLPGRDRDGKTQ